MPRPVLVPFPSEKGEKGLTASVAEERGGGAFRRLVGF